MIYETENKTKREVVSTSLIAYHLKRLGWRVRWAKIEDHFLVDVINPDLVGLSDTANPENIMAAKYIKRRGYPLMTFEGEASYMPNFYPEQMVWGWNFDKVHYEDLSLISNEYSKAMCVEQGKDPSRYRVCGIHRLDIYRTTSFMSKQEFLMKYNLPPGKKVVTYAGWSFEPFFDPSMMLYRYAHYSDDICERIRHLKDAVRDWLADVIQAFPDVVFVLKRHPAGELRNSEVEGLDRLPNVLLLKDEELAPDLISASNVWMAFNSTTILEAFFMGKPVIAPILDERIRPILLPTVAGADCVSSAEETIAGLRRYLTNSGKIEPEQQQIRARLIQEIAGGDDGLNALRSAQETDRFMRDTKLRGSPHLDWAFIRSFLRSVARRSGTVLYDNVGLHHPVLKRLAGSNRFRRQTLRSTYESIHASMDAFMQKHDPL